jgi:hypothetical protein
MLNLKCKLKKDDNTLTIKIKNKQRKATTDIQNTRQKTKD